MGRVMTLSLGNALLGRTDERKTRWLNDGRIANLTKFYRNIWLLQAFSLLKNIIAFYLYQLNKYLFQ